MLTRLRQIRGGHDSNVRCCSSSFDEALERDQVKGESVLIAAHMSANAYQMRFQRTRLA